VEVHLKFSKEDKLLTQQDFSEVFKEAHARSQILNFGPFTVYKQESRGSPRLGLSIARRVVAKSHDRNRIKRCVREFFRLNKDDLRGNLIIRLKSRPDSFEYDKLTRPLKTLLSSKGQRERQV